ncbi:hypothetical protein JCM8097_003454 [Rhodosporidiobolus ruineniae]
MADSSAAPPAASTSSSTTRAAPSADDHLARGIRALALKKWSDACDELAQAVEASTKKHGDLAQENVEALVLYGKALLNSAIAQSAVLGGGALTGEPADPNAASAPADAASGSSSAAAGPSNPKFHFGGDAEDDEDDEQEEGGEGEGDEEGAPGGDREDDLESAFQVLDLARGILSKTIDDVESQLEVDAKENGGKEKDALGETRRREKERLADVHRLLGDVATESEQFDNAVTEYSSALSLLTAVLPPYDRALAELHMLMALALDFVPDATSRAVSHAEKAKEVLKLKLSELEKTAEGERSEKERKEIEDIKGLMGDVDMKIEDLRTIPTAPAPTASDAALEALLRGSLGAVASASASGTVNDLTGLVKKKKKPVEKVVVEETVEGGEKGGAEENVLVVVGAPKKEEEEASAGEEKGKRKADAQEEETETKKQKVEP